MKSTEPLISNHILLVKYLFFFLIHAFMKKKRKKYYKENFYLKGIYFIYIFTNHDTLFSLIGLFCFLVKLLSLLENSIKSKRSFDIPSILCLPSVVICFSTGSIDYCSGSFVHLLFLSAKSVSSFKFGNNAFKKDKKF